MLFGNESISHYSRANIAIWMAMAFQAGVLNIGGFMACHRFVSHVTGFATFFGYEMNQIDKSHALGMLLVPLFFLFGVMISGQLVDHRLQNHKKPRYFITFGFMFLLIMVVLIAGQTGFFGVFGEPLKYERDYILLALLCLTCGLQNGTITTVSRSVIRTTHLTGVTTDLGIGLVRLFNKDYLTIDQDTEFKNNFMRLGIIFCFLIGSVIGGYCFTSYNYLGFALPALSSGILFFLMFYYQVFRANEKTGT